MIGNVIAGSTDHGVVLRDKCLPVMINNLIYNCPSGGIAVQNQCDALLVNNTIVNSAVGIKFFDHTGRWGPPLLPHAWQRQRHGHQLHHLGLFDIIVTGGQSLYGRSRFSCNCHKLRC